MFHSGKPRLLKNAVWRLILLTLAIFASMTPAAGAGKNPEKAQPGRHIEDQFGTYNNQFLLRYVDSVGRRLNAQLPRGEYSFKFRIVDLAEPSAFALPSGHIYISRGLLALINSEDELAALLAHEMSHITLGHTVRQAQKDSDPEFLLLPNTPLRKAIAENLGEMINTPIDVSEGLPFPAYSQSEEVQADQAGMNLAAEAGYNPNALGPALSTMARAIELMPDIRARTFFDPYPVTPGRLGKIDDFSDQIEWTPGRPFARNKAALLKRLNRLRWGEQIPANGVFEGQRFLHPGLNITLTFPEGWQLANTPNYVGGFEKDRKAMIVLGGAARAADPELIGQQFIADVEEEIELSPTENRKVDVGDWPGYVVRYEDTAGDAPISLYYLWVTSPGMTMQLIGLGADMYRDQLRDTVLSLHNLTPEERESIFSYRLEITEATPGESLPALSIRAGNTLSDELTAVINGLPTGVLLEEGDLVKVVRAELHRQ
jgi:predicted Zn-dependent protease